VSHDYLLEKCLRSRARVGEGFGRFLTRRFRKTSFIACVVFIATATGLSQDQQSSRPLNMLVLGDSIMWGQGLKREHKSWYLVKLSLEKSTGRTVVERVEAHSGAVIERSSATEHLRAPDPEIDVNLPTINDELDSALLAYPDRSMIDVVLLTGCANDVGTINLSNAAATSEIDDMTEAKCGLPMVNLLRRITASFPKAQVIVSGYYPFFSEKTRNDFVLKGLAKRLLKIVPGAPKLPSKEMLRALTRNSNAWYHASNSSLAEAVRKVNAESDSGNQRVVFAKIEFSPDYSFAAPRTHLWGFNRSPWRMMLLLLSFGKILLPANDDVRKQRKKSCDQVFRKPDGITETPEAKKARKNRLIFCNYASLGHPNRKGAVLYANTIMNLLGNIRF
jgi:lysophospholipase L1-like esterase